MENNEILQRLLQDDKETKSTVKDESKSKATKNGDSQISTVRVVTAKYKVYIVLLLIFICLLWLIYIPKIDKTLDTNTKAYNKVEAELTNIEKEINYANEDMNLLCRDDWIVKNEEILKSCLNERTNCSRLPANWKVWTGEEMSYDLDIPLSYLQLHSLYNKKMPVDEKLVLKNLNEYLIKMDISWGDRNRVWDILKIEIWDPEQVNDWDEHFVQVPVDVEIEFPTVNDLVEFLYNVEKKMIEKWEDRILYKIQAVSYDIVTNDEPQITEISMIAYYYYDEKFNDNTADIIANVNGEKIKLSKKEWTDLPNNVTLKEQIKKSEVIEAKDLFEMPERIEVEFKDWKWIDVNKKWENQELSINIKRKPECDSAYYNTGSNKKIDNWADSDDSVSMFDKIFSSINL